MCLEYLFNPAPAAPLLLWLLLLPFLWLLNELVAIWVVKWVEVLNDVWHMQKDTSYLSLAYHVIYVEDCHTSRFPTWTWTLPTPTTSNRGSRHKSVLAWNVFLFFTLLTSIYNQATFTEWTTRWPPSETTKKRSRLICVLSLGEFICSFLL